MLHNDTLDIKTPIQPHMAEEAGQHTESDWEFNFSDMVEASVRLKNILEQETQFLRAMQIQQMGELQETKHQLVHILELQKQYINEHPEVLEKLSMGQREKLRQASAALSAELLANHRELTIARSINQKVVELVAQAMERDVGTGNGYSATGDQGIRIKHNVKGIGPVAFSEAV